MRIEQRLEMRTVIVISENPIIRVNGVCANSMSEIKHTAVVTTSERYHLSLAGHLPGNTESIKIRLRPRIAKSYLLNGRKSRAYQRCQFLLGKIVRTQVHSDVIIGRHHGLSDHFVGMAIKPRSHFTNKVQISAYGLLVIISSKDSAM